MTNSTESTPISILASDFKTHIVLVFLIVSLIGGLVFSGVYGVETIIGKIRAADDSKAASQLQTVQTAQTVLEARIEHNEAIESQRDAEQQAIINKLTAALTARDAQATKDKQTASTLNAADTAAAISVRMNAGPGEVTAKDDAVVLDLPISRQINIDLIALAQTQGDLSDTKGQLTATQVQLTDCRADVTDLKADKTAAATTLQAQIKKDNDDIQVEKNKGTKKGIKGFFIGALTVIAVVIGHAI